MYLGNKKNQIDNSTDGSLDRLLPLETTATEENNMKTQQMNDANYKFEKYYQQIDGDLFEIIRKVPIAALDHINFSAVAAHDTQAKLQLQQLKQQQEPPQLQEQQEQPPHQQTERKKSLTDRKKTCFPFLCVCFKVDC